MRLISHSFSSNDNLPVKYSCNGQGVLPDLSWSEFPDKTKSFVLLIEDPDAPSGTFIHFLAINIPLNVNNVKEGENNISQGNLITNHGGGVDYVPACPPNGEHHYIFRIFALDTGNLKGISKENYLEKIKPYIIDQAQILTKFIK